MEFPRQWLHGSPDCSRHANPAFHIHRLDEGTYALRQNKCSSFEGPFLYLVLGRRTALLLDSGAEPENGRPLPIRETVEQILIEQGKENFHLVVAHTHSHTDHVFGDRSFATRSNTEIVKPGRQHVQSAFGISRWPNDNGSVELGSRRLVVIPTPGHEESHIALYDEKTRAIFSGDTLYPGLLVVRDWPVYRASAARLAAFVRTHPTEYVLGAHIEMKRAAGQLYSIGTQYQPDEHRLQLGPEHAEELHEVCERLGDSPDVVVRPDFIVQPVLS